MNTVEKIHREIDTAQVRLLEQAESLISNLKTNVDDKDVTLVKKADRLASLGFVKSKDVEKASKIKELIKKNQS